MARSYRELLVAEGQGTRGHIYQATEQFPKHETYGLTSQIRRAAVSVASKLITPEVDTQLAIALDLNYLKKEKYEELDEQIYQVLGLLNRLMDSLRKKRL